MHNNKNQLYYANRENKSNDKSNRNNETKNDESKLPTPEVDKHIKTLYRYIYHGIRQVANDNSSFLVTLFGNVKVACGYLPLTQKGNKYFGKIQVAHFRALRLQEDANEPILEKAKEGYICISINLTFEYTNDYTLDYEFHIYFDRFNKEYKRLIGSSSVYLNLNLMMNARHIVENILGVLFYFINFDINSEQKPRELYDREKRQVISFHEALKNVFTNNKSVPITDFQDQLLESNNNNPVSRVRFRVNRLNVSITTNFKLSPVKEKIPLDDLGNRVKFVTNPNKINYFFESKISLYRDGIERKKKVEGYTNNEEDFRRLTSEVGYAIIEEMKTTNL